jgi:hypothetical protein
MTGVIVPLVKVGQSLILVTTTVATADIVRLAVLAILGRLIPGMSSSSSLDDASSVIDGADGASPLLRKAAVGVGVMGESGSGGKVSTVVSVVSVGSVVGGGLGGTSTVARLRPRLVRRGVGVEG